MTFGQLFTRHLSIRWCEMEEIRTAVYCFKRWRKNGKIIIFKHYSRWQHSLREKASGGERKLWQKVINFKPFVGIVTQQGFETSKNSLMWKLMLDSAPYSGKKLVHSLLRKWWQKVINFKPLVGIVTQQVLETSKNSFMWKLMLNSATYSGKKLVHSLLLGKENYGKKSSASNTW